MVLSLFGLGAFWDFSVIKNLWNCYPLPFDIYCIEPRWMAGDAILSFTFIGLVIINLAWATWD